MRLPAAHPDPVTLADRPFRQTPRARELLELDEGGAIHAGRGHEIGQPHPLYLATRPGDPWKHLQRQFENVDITGLRRRYGAVVVHLTRVLDLSSSAVRDELGVTPEDLVAEDPSVCRQLVAYGWEHGFQAVVLPSAVTPGDPEAKTVIIHPAHVHPPHVVVDVDLPDVPVPPEGER